MSCSSCFTSVSHEKSRKLMFGPLYAQYAHSNLADIHLTRTFSNERSLVPQYVPDCCAYVSTNFRGSAHWKLYATLLGVWFVYVGIMLAAFLSIRKTQLVKIRGTSTTMVYLFTVAGLFSITIISGMTAGSDPKFITPILGMIFIPFYLFLPMLKSLQVLFIYKWHEAKAKRSEDLKWYSRWRFVLSIRFYLASSLAVFVLVVVPLLASLFIVAPAFTGHGRTSFSSTRCTWWHIPDELTVATTNSSMCGCIRAAFFAEGDERLLCEEAFISKCLGSSSIPTTLEAELCTSCLSSLSTGSSSSECATAFVNFYASGACGFPSRTPYFDSCVSGLFADQRIMFALYSVCYLFFGLHLLVIAPVLFKRDYFGTILENILTMINSIPPITSVLFYYQFPSLVSWWSSDLPFTIVVAAVVMYLMPMIILGVPIFLHLWRKRKFGCFVFSSKQATVDKSLTVIASGESDHEAGVLRAVDPNEAAVQQCITSEPLKAIYLKFSVEEFTTENIRFLEECIQMLVTFNSHFNTKDLVIQAQRLYDQFIATGSDMEVNLSGSLKMRVQKHLQTLQTTDTNFGYVAGITTGYSRRPSLAVTLDEVTSISEEELLVEALKRAFEEVVRLMARSSWPRFKRSRHYPEFLEKKAEIERNINVEKQVMAWLGNEPTRNPNLNPNANLDDTLNPEAELVEVTINRAVHPRASLQPTVNAAMEIVPAVGAAHELKAILNANANPPTRQKRNSLNPLLLLSHRRGTETPTPETDESS